uniref:Uncharacterized protein n=1 Tax=Megaselia scalaris TaxID=36166 RepID=T1GLL3_MEGSC
MDKNLLKDNWSLFVPLNTMVSEDAVPEPLLEQVSDEEEANLVQDQFHKKRIQNQFLRKHNVIILNNRNGYLNRRNYGGRNKDFVYSPESGDLS